MKIKLIIADKQIVGYKIAKRNTHKRALQKITSSEAKLETYYNPTDGQRA